MGRGWGDYHDDVGEDCYDGGGGWNDDGGGEGAVMMMGDDGLYVYDVCCHGYVGRNV